MDFFSSFRRKPNDKKSENTNKTPEKTPENSTDKTKDDKNNTTATSPTTSPSKETPVSSPQCERIERRRSTRFIEAFFSPIKKGKEKEISLNDISTSSDNSTPTTPKMEKEDSSRRTLEKSPSVDTS